ncbi:glycerol-3-phosphate dehydrogenase/oxidase [Paenibacillus sp. T3-5-0-4]|nr:glycerol-3-phosphate dehydrogenase/oxidase [Paenibacillus endoradicis]MCR8659965.1 glycerol-3-phosphate dehydrogenase/oxidase [Paenibacillus endoradicis]
MAAQKLDILVIGGGITGAGIALDAATRGLSLGLIEMQDFAGGTSSRSTKLVHGGLRYLKNLEIAVVAEVGKEREIVYENGPHVTTPEWMLLPLYAGGSMGKFTTSIGLRLYDFLAGVKKTERRKMLNVEQTLAKEPLLKSEGMKGGGYYVEYRTDDARLTIEVMKKARELGSIAVNYTKAESLIYDAQKKVIGVTVRDLLSEKIYELYANKIINATGPWVDELREQDGSKKGKTLRLTKGVHLVFDGSRFPLRQAVYFDTSDGRMVFAIPREGKTYFGTTDTNYTSDTANPVTTEGDRKYLIAAANDIFPKLKLTDKDVESSWAGLRPLIQQEGKSPSEISRRDEIFVSESGLISIAGGKLTGYRKMAEDVVNKTVELMKQDGMKEIKNATSTRYIPISGGDFGGSNKMEAYVQTQVAVGVKQGLSKKDATLLANRFGTNVPIVLELAKEAVAWGKPFGLTALPAIMLQYAMRYEMAAKPVDYFIRRTGDMFFRINDVITWREPVLLAMNAALGWTDEQLAEYTAELDRKIDEAKNSNKE